MSVGRLSDDRELRVGFDHTTDAGTYQRLVVADEGPGFPQADPTERGRSGIGSTGLGLDIARRIAESSGGTLMIGHSASGGGVVTIGFGPPDAVTRR